MLAEFQAQARFGGFSIDGGVAYVDSELDPVTVVNSRALPPIGGHVPAGTYPADWLPAPATAACMARPSERAITNRGRMGAMQISLSERSAR